MAFLSHTLEVSMCFNAEMKTDFALSTGAKNEEVAPQERQIEWELPTTPALFSLRGILTQKKREIAHTESNWGYVTSFGYLIIPLVKLTGICFFVFFGRKCNKMKPPGIVAGLKSNNMIWFWTSLSCGASKFTGSQLSNLFVCRSARECDHSSPPMLGCFTALTRRAHESEISNLSIGWRRSMFASPCWRHPVNAGVISVFREGIIGILNGFHSAPAPPSPFSPSSWQLNLLIHFPFSFYFRFGSLNWIWFLMEIQRRFKFKCTQFRSIE